METLWEGHTQKVQVKAEGSKPWLCSVPDFLAVTKGLSLLQSIMAGNIMTEGAWLR